jgi:hypothetical protein
VNGSLQPVVSTCGAASYNHREHSGIAMIEQVDWSLLTEAYIVQAVLGKSIEFFEKEKGIRFASACDGLDYYKAALLSIDSARQIPIVLKQYRGGTPNSVCLYFPPAVKDVDVITTLVVKVVSDLGLCSDDIRWQRKDNPEA